MAESAELETMNYRLTNIEGKLSRLEQMLTQEALQERDISELQKSVSRFLNLYTEQSERLRALEEKQTNIEEVKKALNAHDKRIEALELAPLQTRAEKWTVIVDYIFKAIIALTCTMLLSKVGLSL